MHAKAVELGKHVVRMTSAAGSGHPSTALALSHLVVELMYRQMRHDPANPWHPTADRLVLSIGHAVPIVYAAWADLGGVAGPSPDRARPVTVEQLAELRSLHSVLDGHPNPAEGFPFFDAATGSLGQGLSVAAGLAAAARLDGSPRRVFALLGDGESREGQVWEALDFIADQRLQNVCVTFSCNGHGQAGPVSAQQSAETLAAKLQAFGFAVVDIDGHDPVAVAEAYARFGEAGRPLAIVARTIKGWGVDLMLGQNYHGKPVPAEQVEEACAQLDATGRRLGAQPGEAMRPPAPMPAPACASVPAQPASPGEGCCCTGGGAGECAGPQLPAFAEVLTQGGYEAALAKRKLATRAAYGAALQALGAVDERVVAIDADVSNSTYANAFAKAFPQRFFEAKIAEQNMISVGVGLAAAGHIPFASSFAKFLVRGYDQLDMASLTRANLKLVGSHAGVSLGADGPSQMAVTDVAYLRSFAGVDTGDGRPAAYLFQPADAVCAVYCTGLMARLRGLCYMRTHRPAAPFLYSPDETFPVRGCKQLREGGQLTLVSSGYMLHTVLQAADELAEQGIGCNVFDVYTFPLDATPIIEAARQSRGLLLCVEDNYSGGLDAELGLAVAGAGDLRLEALTVSRIPKSARSAEQVFAYVGVGREQIIEHARALTGHAD